ncbi:MAG: hypothetical protein QF425_11605, partial [Dehalococcoidia bacterium]|nr:hypothetical protein [Dehalococcoidia bacterium]
EERAAVRAEMQARPRRSQPDPEFVRESAELRARLASSSHIGGALDYLITTPEGTIFFQDSMGYFTGILNTITPDVALLAAAGRGNIDGEPIQGSVEQFIAGEVQMLTPQRVVLGHHDNWVGTPDVPDITDMTPVHEELQRVAPDVEVVEVGYLEGTTLF